MIKTNNKFDELTVRAIKNQIEHNQRRGQSFMNALNTVDQSLYEKITGSNVDCFYDDKLCGAFLRFVFLKWEDEINDSN